MNSFSATEDEPVLLNPVRTLMDDNVKFSTQEYRNALYSKNGETFM
jgi:hypothetical protein